MKKSTEMKNTHMEGKTKKGRKKMIHGKSLIGIAEGGARTLDLEVGNIILE
jgi:hypothetical protein